MNYSKYISFNSLVYIVGINTSIAERHKTGLPRVRKISRKNKIFFKSEKSGNFEKMSGNLGYLTHVREFLGNFVVSCQGISGNFILS